MTYYMPNMDFLEGVSWDKTKRDQKDFKPKKEGGGGW